MKIFERDGKLLSVNGVQSESGCGLKDEPGTDPAAGIVEHVQESVFEIRIESRRQRQRPAEGIGETTRIQSIHHILRAH